jgi:diguanylate cyclase (GGDEF)-like protein
VWSDHLTGLANRRAFFDAASTAAQRCTQTGQPITIVLFDADHFKTVNDTHGHAAGDAVLRHLAAGLSATFKPTDVVARFGGEEFVVLLTDSSVAEAQATAERFRAHIASNPVTVDSVQVPCTVSGGVASCSDGMSGIDELLRRSDIALYAAKAAGRDRVAVWDEALEPRGRAVVGLVNGASR